MQRKVAHQIMQSVTRVIENKGYTKRCRKHYLIFRKETLEVRFHSLDADKSGDLDMGELLATVMEEAGVDEEQARTFIKDGDVDNNGTIDTDEFIAMWIKLKG